MRGLQDVARGIEERAEAFPYPIQAIGGEKRQSLRDGSAGTPGTVAFPLLRPAFRGVLAAWRWLEQRRTAQMAGRRLRLVESLSLGEKRFVSLLEVDGAQFLIGGSAGTIQLLATLGEQGSREAAAMATVREELS